MRVERNVIYNVLGTAMCMNHDNFGHVVQNNIFALCGCLVNRACYLLNGLHRDSLSQYLLLQ